MVSNKVKYNIEYRKKHKKQFSVDLNIQEYNDLVELLQAANLTKVGFIRKYIPILKEEVRKK